MNHQRVFDAEAQIRCPYPVRIQWLRHLEILVQATVLAIVFQIARGNWVANQSQQTSTNRLLTRRPNLPSAWEHYPLAAIAFRQVLINAVRAPMFDVNLTLHAIHLLPQLNRIDGSPVLEITDLFQYLKLDSLQTSNPETSVELG